MIDNFCLIWVAGGILFGFIGGILFWLYNLQKFFAEYAESGRPYPINGEEYTIRREA